MQVVGDVDSTLPDVLEELGIRLSRDEMRINIRPLLRMICGRFLKDFSGFVEMCVEHIPSPADNARTKVQHVYTGPVESDLGDDMCGCDPDVSLVYLLTIFSFLGYVRYILILVSFQKII